MRQIRKLLAYGLPVVFVVLIICSIAFWADRDITVYDSRFCVLDHSVSTGITHTIYNGSQIEGRIRAKIKHQFGLNVKDLSAVSVGVGHEGLAFLLRYKGDLPFVELDGLKAVLTNDNDISIDLGMGVKRYDQRKKTFIICYTLSKLPTDVGPFRIVFTLKSADQPIASWKIGDLGRHNKRLNSDGLTPAD